MALLNQGYDNVPQALQSLKTVNQLLIKQKVERLEGKQLNLILDEH